MPSTKWLGCDITKDYNGSCTPYGTGTGTGTGTETKTGIRNNGFLYYAMYCTYYIGKGTGTGTGTHLQFTPKMLTTIIASNDSE